MPPPPTLIAFPTFPPPPEPFSALFAHSSPPSPLLPTPPDRDAARARPRPRARPRRRSQLRHQYHRGVRARQCPADAALPGLGGRLRGGAPTRSEEKKGRRKPKQKEESLGGGRRLLIRVDGAPARNSPPKRSGETSRRACPREGNVSKVACGRGGERPGPRMFEISSRNRDASRKARAALGLNAGAAVQI